MSTAFGFGHGVTGGDGAANSMTMLISSKAQLVEALKSLAQFNAERAPMVLELQTPTTDPYDFSGAATKDDQSFPIRAKNVTIRGKAGSTISVHNINLDFDLRFIDNILIENIAFRSNGAKDNARDAIEFNAPGADTNQTPDPFLGNDPQARVRITGCSFDGYFDISIDSRSRIGFPRLLATIDHCLFFDSRPGQGDFANRGAINLTGANGATANTNVQGSAAVTIALNAFINVWRRIPRVVQGNIAHIFNNVLYRWGAGNDTNDTWVGMAIGFGTGNGRVDGNGIAVIQANRFIPYPGKEDLRHAIAISPDAQVDIGSGELVNRFDNKDGIERTGADAVPPGRFTQINITSFLPAEARNLPVSPKDTANWIRIVEDAGPAGIGLADKQPLLDLLNR